MKLIIALLACLYFNNSLLIADSDTFSKERLENFYDEFACDEKNILNGAGITPPCSTTTHPNEAGLPPSPKNGLLPIVLVNNLGASADDIYVVMYNPNIGSTSAYFIEFDASGQGTPAPLTATSTSVQYSQKLSDFPFSTANGPDAYLAYIPYVNSARIYFSLYTPLNLLIDPASSPATISPPNVALYIDPNYEFFFENIELTFEPVTPPSPNTIPWTVTANTTSVDAFSGPVEIEYYSYPSTTPLTSVFTQSNSGPAGFNQPKSTLLSAFQNYVTSATSGSTLAKGFWDRLFLSFYDNPYDNSSTNTNLRILSAESGFLATQNSGFYNTNEPFPIDYLSQGPTDFVTAFFNQFNAGANTLTIDTDEQFSGTNVIYTSNNSSSNTALVLDASPAGSTSTPLTLNIDTLSTDCSPFFVGTNFNFTTPPYVEDAFNDRFQDYLGSAFSVGLLPATASGITLNGAYFTNNYSSFFKNSQAPGFPWYNVYAGALHDEAIDNRCYAFPYDDAMSLGSDITPDATTPTSTNPYLLVTLHDATPFPNPLNDLSSYNVTFTYAGSALSYRQGTSGAFTSIANNQTISSLTSHSGMPLQIQYTNTQGTFTFNVYLKYQILQPAGVYDNDTNAVINGTTFTPDTVPNPTGFTLNIPVN